MHGQFLHSAIGGWRTNEAMTVKSKPIVTMFHSVEHHPGITDYDAMLRYALEE